jgi:hypothetical protein
MCRREPIGGRWVTSFFAARCGRQGSECTSLAWSGPARVLACVFLGALLLPIGACKKTPPQFTPPPAAQLAVSVAKRYAETNGCPGPMVEDAVLKEGQWIIMLLSKHREPVIVRVSLSGEVVGYSGVK